MGHEYGSIMDGSEGWKESLLHLPFFFLVYWLNWSGIHFIIGKKKKKRSIKETSFSPAGILTLMESLVGKYHLYRVAL